MRNSKSSEQVLYSKNSTKDTILKQNVFRLGHVNSHTQITQQPTRYKMCAMLLLRLDAHSVLGKKKQKIKDTHEHNMEQFMRQVTVLRSQKSQGAKPQTTSKTQQTLN